MGLGLSCMGLGLVVWLLMVADWWLSWYACYIWQWKWNYVMLCFFFCRLWWNRKHHVLRMWWPRSCWTQVTFAFCFLIAFCCTLLLQRLQLGCHICCSYVALQCCSKVFVYRPFHFSMVLFLCNLPLIFWMVLIRIHFIGKLLIMFPLPFYSVGLMLFCLGKYQKWSSKEFLNMITLEIKIW